MRSSILILAILTASLSACRTNDAQRAVIGAAAGAVVADATGGNAATGALIGAVGGALCDDLTGTCN